MRQFLLILILPLLLSINFTVLAQSFDEALDLYNGEQFKEAAEMFAALDDERSVLFAGKSYLALSEYSKAETYLNRASRSRNESVYEEALYSLSLAHFGQNNYAQSLEFLYRTIESNNAAGLRIDARRLYTQILNYLSADERFETLHKLETSSIRFDLVNRSRSYLEAEQYEALLSELRNITTNPATLRRIEDELSISSQIQTFVHPYPEAPIGKVYNVGVILPTFNTNHPDFTIPRNLYFGMLLAADDFNSRNTEQKVNLFFRNASENPDTTAKVFSDLISEKSVDAVIGPLFSEPAVRMAAVAEEHRVPMLAPLANSDELHLNYTYTFQLNPTFEMHGKLMARYAVEQLGLQNIAIMIEEGEPGRPSALAFRREAERLGANITYFIEQNFAVRGYDLSEYTEVFTTDDQFAGRRIDAIYAPFSGQAATTMMSLLLNELEAMRSDPVILGTEMWEEILLTDFQHRFFEIYCSQAFGDFEDSEMYQFFIEDYENRFGTSPDRFSMVGYDAASYMFQSLETAGNPAYSARALSTLPPYIGLTMNVNFDGERINQHVFLRPLTNKAKQRIEEQNR